MEGLLSEDEKQGMVSMFLEIAVGQTADTATQFLQATGWQLEEAIQLFYIGNEAGAASAPCIPPPENEAFIPDQDLVEAESNFGYENVTEYDGSEVRAPIPVIRDVLYDSPYETPRYGILPRAVDTSEEEQKRQGVWDADKGGSTSAAESSNHNLASLYRPPFALMFNGPFEKAKEAANGQDRWLLVNVQSTREFSSHMLNRDTWGNEAVAQTITSNFIFWQIYDDTEEGSKISTYYRLDSFPVTIVIDPITGQKMRLWRGMIHPESLLEDLLQFMDGSPKEHHASLSNKRRLEISQASPPKIQEETIEDDEDMKLARALSLGTMEDNGEEALKDSGAVEDVPKKEKLSYPPLPEEPKGDRNLLCRVGVRLPDGKRLQRNFLLSDPIQLLWSFCAANCGEDKPFRMTYGIPGSSKDLEYESTLTFGESGLANSMISVTWSEV
ncbi:Thioredoxin-like fold [Artemisia annua]|uniref:Thioredoxin-like fold n=1 Tax=Artemisia annua TaxID=35608 RepID=A0A2U1PAS1_ARTAN|nr:Thioredoxin-like fold [Artemisia annua]